MIYHIHFDISIHLDISQAIISQYKVINRNDAPLSEHQGCGAALYRMIKLQRETLQQKKGHGRILRERKGIMELELDFLQDLTMEDISSLSPSL